MNRTLSVALATALTGALAAQFAVTDLVTPPASQLSGSPRAGITVGGIAYFPGSDEFGEELWRSDGTQPGTYRVKDLAAGSASSRPANFVELGGIVYFSADTPGQRRELWRTDGTASGTRLVLDIRPGRNHSGFNSDLIVYRGRLYFAGNDGAFTWPQLWTSDGTAAGTHLVRGINPGIVNDLTVFNNRLWFEARGGGGAELYSSDGTAVGTRMFLDIGGSSSSGPGQLTVSGSRLFFAASTSTAGRELWSTDGTVAGTRMAADIRPGGPSAGILYLTSLGNGVVVFRATEGTSGIEPWRSDGTTAGTFRLADIQPGTASAGIGSGFASTGNGWAVFDAIHPTQGHELFITDGSTGGTRLLADLRPGSSSTPRSFGLALGRVVFRAIHPTHGDDLWITDGTAAGTYGLNVAPGSNSPREWTPFGNHVLFAASGQRGNELYSSDGTQAGTGLVADLYQTAGHADPEQFHALGNKLWFVSKSDRFGLEPFVSDGTASGTTSMDLNPGTSGSSPDHSALWNQRVWFEASTGAAGVELYSSDGTPSGSGLSVDFGAGNSRPEQLVAFGNRLAGSAIQPGIGQELFVTTGTLAGTTALDLNPGAPSSSPREITVVGNRVFCVATHPTLGRELFVSDGTAVGTQVLDVRPGAGGSSANELTAFGGKLFFRAADVPANHLVLWESDGTPAGTKVNLLHNVATTPTNLVATSNRLFFLGVRGSPSLGRELWSTDGTNAAMVKDIVPGNAAAIYHDMIAVGSRLFLIVDDRVNGRELWVSDGTANGTRMVVDLLAGAGDGALAGSLTAVPGSSTVVFAGTDGGDGLQLWQSDGTAAGTTQLGRIGNRAGSGAARIGEIRNVGTNLFFACDDGAIGNELWVYSLTTGQRAFTTTYGSGCRGSAGIPAIGARGLPALGNASFGIRLTSARPRTPAAVLLSGASARVVLSSSCRLLTALPLIALPTVVTDATGTATTPLPIPNDTGLLGGRIYGQYAVVDPNGNYLNSLAFSDGLQMVVGR